jgi:UDPglucose 6-dehydrogenase
VSNPEFLREGSAIADTLCPDRIVIGAPNQIVAMKILELYAPLERPMIITDVASAEMIKYASNAFLATKISFANAVANICEATGADVMQVVKGMGLDDRIGQAFLQPGLGYGGSCFPKDTRSLLYTAQKFGYDFPLLAATIETNERQPERFIARMERALGGFAGKKIAVLGLSFKANTDDIRDAKSLDVIAALLAGGATVTAYDPIAIENTRRVFPQIGYAKNAFEAAQGAHAVVVVTEWNEFKQINLERLKNTMAGNLVFDGRNLYDPAKMRRLGFEYVCVGRGGAPCAASVTTTVTAD